MKFLLVLAALSPLALAGVVVKDPYPAPCGRSIPSGICASEKTCLDKGGVYVQRDCTFYNVLDIGCCYSIPEDE
ncbi:hypothetical protein EJ04DRAFT_513042 [Polyplosphaeria fusca]|uniref:Uncharacterized protein n=1 Tax=Polyplosphaeria fusca TaxID=682080 RepID=A0A9P4QYQ2_9PLEO|nr:hypothetical protein EJ04DRAFT_513042 [Polyplosphaeria fusca]